MTQQLVVMGKTITVKKATLIDGIRHSLLEKAIETFEPTSRPQEILKFLYPKLMACSFDENNQPLANVTNTQEITGWAFEDFLSNGPDDREGLAWYSAVVSENGHWFSNNETNEDAEETKKGAARPAI